MDQISKTRKVVMKDVRGSIVFQLVLLLWASWAQAQQPSVSLTVPHLVKFSGTLKSLNGTPLAGFVGVTFTLYKDDQGGVPLWIETQNVQLDSWGRYSATLGATKPDGMPADVFTSGEARWLGVQPSGQAEQPRVLLVAVPYAMKAVDAETLGGLPPSAFVLAAPAIASGGGSNDGSAGTLNSASGAPPASSNVTTTGGTANTIPLFTATTNIQNSAITQTGSGTTAKIGIGTTTPGTTLDIKGSETVRGTLSLPSSGTATSTGGKNSQANLMVASVFNSAVAAAVAQKFELQAEPANNNTSSASGTLNLLYGSGTATPAETGLKINNLGQIAFAAGQRFPGTGPGTVTSVGLSAPASDFTVNGSPVTGTGTLSFAWTVPPTSTDTANTIVKRDASGNFAANTITAGNLGGGAVNATTANFTNLTAGSISATSASISSSLYMNSAANVPLFVASNSGNATVIEGAASATTGGAWGVEGTTASTNANAYGVYGLAGASTGNPRGVYGRAASTSGVGSFGQNGSMSSVGSGSVGFLPFSGVGVWGDGGSSGSGTSAVDIPGVVGTSDDSNAGFFANNSTAYYTLEVVNYSSGYLFHSSNASGLGCAIDNSGNLSCTGTKNAVVPIDGGKRKVAMSAIESPQNWFEDAGAAELVNGSAVVALDSDFIQTVNTAHEYLVFPVPNGDCKGLYVSHQTPTSFEVHELGGGASSVRFYYRIMALRKNYENVRFADHTNDPDPRKGMQHRKSAGTQPRSHAATTTKAGY
jgi:hypothetical protein